MPNTREKLIELLGKAQDSGTIVIPTGQGERYEWVSNQKVADYLIANGVTFATDNNVGDKKTPTAKDTNVPSKWIPVTERLPECDQVVLCYKADRGVRTGKHLAATYADGVSAFKDCCRDYAFGATHWMPLPEPPKGE